MAIDSLATHTSTETGTYVPPVAEYEFLLGEAFGTDIVARSTGGALSTEDALDAIADAVAVRVVEARELAALHDVDDTVHHGEAQTFLQAFGEERPTRRGRIG